MPRNGGWDKLKLLRLHDQQQSTLGGQLDGLGLLGLCQCLVDSQCLWFMAVLQEPFGADQARIRNAMSNWLWNFCPDFLQRLGSRGGPNLTQTGSRCRCHLGI